MEEGPCSLIPPATTEGLNLGLNLAWEVDFWGRFRRAIIAAEETLQANCADYNAAMVTLLGDVARYYVQLRTDETRIELIRANAEIQRRVLAIAERRFREGQTNDLDVNQARSELVQTEAQIPLLLSELRAAEVRLCVLMGMPPAAIEAQLGLAPIPAAPATLVVGIPADLLRRRPDVCRAERLAAAQAEQIGIAEVDLYPVFKLDGNMGYSAAGLSQLIETNSFYGTIGPGVQWNILNYGRIRNNIRYQDAKFQEYLTIYRRMVLQAAEEAENGMLHFVQEQDRSKLLDQSVNSLQLAVNTVVKQYAAGGVDFTRVSQVQRSLVEQQDAQAASHGQVAQGLIEVYRALGGGWQFSPNPSPLPQGVPAAAAPPPLEDIPPPPPDVPGLMSLPPVGREASGRAALWRGPSACGPGPFRRSASAGSVSFACRFSLGCCQTLYTSIGSSIPAGTDGSRSPWGPKLFAVWLKRHNSKLSALPPTSGPTAYSVRKSHFFRPPAKMSKRQQVGPFCRKGPFVVPPSGGSRRDRLKPGLRAAFCRKGLLCAADHDHEYMVPDMVPKKRGTSHAIRCTLVPLGKRDLLDILRAV